MRTDGGLREGAPLGVGLIGAGPVVQAIHLPTLARMPERFAVRAVTDPDRDVAATVAQRSGASTADSLGALLDDPTVDVVAICSPPRFHAEQTIAAMRSGVRAVLCEKPLADSREEAERIAAVSAETGVPLLVGAMHTFDPGWLAAEPIWRDLTDAATFIRSRIVLPPNSRFEDLATEVTGRPVLGSAQERGPVDERGAMRSAILGLAIHNLPHVRQFLPAGASLQVTSARLLQPYGYLVTARAADRVVQLTGLMSGRWRPEWTLQVDSPARTLSTAFPPSYVQAGSAVTTVTTAHGSQVVGPFLHNGYEVEWHTLHALANGATTTAPPLQALIDDLDFAVDLADAAAAALEEAA